MPYEDEDDNPYSMINIRSVLTYGAMTLIHCQMGETSLSSTGRRLMQSNPEKVNNTTRILIISPNKSYERLGCHSQLD